MGKFNFKIEEKQTQVEKITLGPNGLKGIFKCYSGKSGDYWVSVIPSLNTSGYGSTEEESREDLKYNMDIFCEDLFNLDKVSRNRELQNLGWRKDKYFGKRYSSAYVDENGVLQNFDSPEEVKQSLLETA